MSKRWSLLGILVTVMLVSGACGAAASPSPEATNTPASVASSTPSATASSSPSVALPAYEQNILQLAGETVDASKYQKTGPYTVAVLFQGAFNGWGKVFQVSADWSAKNNADIKSHTVLDSKGDVNTQLSQLENVLATKPDAIVIQPDGDAIVGDAARATQAGIPVVLCANGLPDPTAYATVISLDFWTTGQEAAEGLAKAMGYKGTVALFTGIATFEGSQIAGQAAQAVFAKYPDITVLAPDYANFDIAKAKADTEAMLAAHPDVNGFFALGGEHAIGAIQAYADRGATMPAFGVVSINNGFLRLAQQYNLRFTAVPSPAGVSAACVSTAVDILKGKSGIHRFIDPDVIVPNAQPFTQDELQAHYLPQFNDDFVDPPVAPLDVYSAAGFNR